MLSRSTIMLRTSRLGLRCFSSEIDVSASQSGTPVEMKGSKVVFTGERGINKVTLLGRVGQDAQKRGSTENPVTVFPLATSFTLKTPAGEYVQKTEWHRVSVFRPVLRDIVNHSVKKGDRVYVQGSLSYSQYKDKNDITQRVTNIVAEDVINVSRGLTDTIFNNFQQEAVESKASNG